LLESSCLTIIVRGLDVSQQCSSTHQIWKKSETNSYHCNNNYRRLPNFKECRNPNHIQVKSIIAKQFKTLAVRPQTFDHDLNCQFTINESCRKWISMIVTGHTCLHQSTMHIQFSILRSKQISKVLQCRKLT
jgi:hypothetical protein